MGLLRRAQPRPAERRASSWGTEDLIPPPSASLFSPEWMMYGPGEERALAIPTAASCVTALATDVSMLPFRAYAGPQGTHSPVKVQPPLVDQPFGPDLEPAAGIGSIVTSMAMRGNAFLNVARRDPSTGLPLQLQILHPDAVTIIPNAYGTFDVRVNGREFDRRDLIVIPRQPVLPGSFLGMDPIAYYAALLRATSNAYLYGANLLENGAMPSGIIQVEGEGSLKKARNIRAIWNAGHQGAGNAHKVGVLFGGESFKEMAFNPEQVQLLQTRTFLREDICGMFGVPPQRIQILGNHASQGGGKGLETLDDGYATHTLQAYTAPIERAWSRMMPGGQEGFARFSFRGLLRADAGTRATIAASGRTAAWITINEIRAEEDLPPVEGGDNLFIPLNSAISEPADPSVGPADSSSGGPTS